MSRWDGATTDWGDLPPDRAEAQGPSWIVSDALLGSHGLLVMEHKGEACYLRITGNGKLILTR